MMIHSRTGITRVLLVTVAVLAGGLLTVGASPASASVTSVSGLAFGYYVNTGLFGGAQSVRGYGQTIPPGDAASESPSVSLPSGGGNLTQTDPDGAAGIYGPAHIFENHGSMIVSTQGTTGANGAVTSSAVVDDIQPYDPFTAPAPGGVQSTCTADENGLTGSTTITNGRLVINDPDPDVFGEPGEVIVTPPLNPEAGTEYAGLVGNVNDYFTIVFNEQIFSADSITVNAVHMYMEGPVSVGDVVIAQSQCGVAATSTNQAPVANDDTYSTGVGQVLTVPAPGLLGNDTDPEAGPVTARKIPPTPPPPTGTLCDPYPAICAVWPSPSDTANGSLTLHTDGSFTYTPKAGFHGTDSFTYLVVDQRGKTDTAIVTIGVTPLSYLAVNNVWVAEGNAGTTTANFTITRSGKTNASTTVSYATSNAAAIAGSDYTAIGATPVTFAAGETTKTVAVSITGDTQPEVNETFYVVLSSPVGGTISDSSGTGTIMNDDGRAQLSIDNVWVTEGNAGTVTANFTITRSVDTSGSSTVNYSTSSGTAVAGTDFTAIPVTPVAFAPGETTKPVTVNVAGDTLAEAHEAFYVVLSSAVGAVVSDGTGVGTIQNDDGTAFLSIDDVTVTEGNAGTTTATFTITRTGNTTGSSSVTYATSNGTAVAGSDYAALAATPVTFAAGETSKPVAVSVTGDAVDETNETFNVTLSGATGAILSDTTGIGTIVDDEGAVTPGPATFYAVQDLMLPEGNGGGTTPATFTVTRSGNTTGAGSIKYSTANGSAVAPDDFTPIASTTLNFAAGETSKPVTVNVAADGLSEGDEGFYLGISTAVGGVITDPFATATLVNDDFTTYAVNDIQKLESDSGTTTATFTVTRAGSTTGIGSVKYNTVNASAVAPGDYASLGLTTLDFAAGETSKPVTVTVVGDTVIEGDEVFNLVLTAPVAGVVADATGIATILNDDFAPLSISDRSIAEGNSGTKVLSFAVTRSGPTHGTASFTWATANGTATAGSDYTAVGATVVSFAAGETVKVVSVTVAGDATVEPWETFNVNLTVPVNVVIVDATGAGVIANDD